MFEKFTQKAIDVVQAAQNYAVEFNHAKILSQHLLLGLFVQSKGVQAKILGFDKINFGELNKEIFSSETNNPNQNPKKIIFSLEIRDILKTSTELSQKLNSKFVMPQHIALAIFSNKNCGAYKILKKFDIDEEKIISNLKRMLDKSSDIKALHPEEEIENTELTNINDFFKEKTISEILSIAQSKLIAPGYEILGTEQILQSILDNQNYEIVNILEKYNITSKTFMEELSHIHSRKAEFENSEKQIIFTPNAFLSLMLALDYAKESGSTEIKAEHIILGILKSKKGIAYQILSELLPKGIDFEDIVMKKLNDKIPETLAILRLAKEEAINLNCSTLGTEMILLGILSYGAGIASDTLRRLGITLKDAREEVEKLITPQKEIKNITYSQRAKKMLEVAYETAQEHKRNKIKSENLL